MLEIEIYKEAFFCMLIYQSYQLNAYFMYFPNTSEQS